MNLLDTTKAICQKYNIIPSRTKGQNFLIDENAYNEMIVAADLKGGEHILEVGPGLGFLTERLARRVQTVYAVELDDAIAKILPQRLEEAGVKNVKVYNEDILNFNSRFAADLKGLERFSVVANLPYNISSYFLRKFIAGNEGGLVPERMTLMLQKEVGERLVAEAGDMSILSVSVQFYANVRITKIIPAASFWPAPKVGSAVVAFTRRDDYRSQLAALGIPEKNFFRLVKIGFSARRKMLKANLAAGFHIAQPAALELLDKAGIGPKVRPQELSMPEWLKLIAVSREFVL